MTMTDELKAERDAFEKWMQCLEGFPFARQFSNLMWKAWQARAKLDRAEQHVPDLLMQAGYKLLDGDQESPLRFGGHVHDANGLQVILERVTHTTGGDGDES